MKKTISLLLAVVMLLSALSFAGVTAFAATSGDYEYELLDDGTAEITGYTGSETDLTIPSDIDGYTVTRIGNTAFYLCRNLTNITIPDSVTTIGDGAFLACTALTNITIPGNITSIGEGAFRECSSLTSIGVDEKNKNYSSQDGVLFNKNKTELVAYPSGNNSNSYTIPNGVTTIGYLAFYLCEDLTNITIPDSVTTIGDSAFFACTALTNITIPDSVTTIGDRAFSECSNLRNITIPDSVTTIGNSVFHSSNLTSIDVDENNKFYSSEDGVLFNKNKTEIVAYPSGNNSNSYTIPNGVTAIGDGAFYMCRNLTNITIPNSVTTIGDSAFSVCEHLTNITIPDSVTSIGDSAFSGCSNLTNITIPNSVTTIGTSTFYMCSNLTNITIPNSVTTIGSSAFYMCGNLTNITIPDSVTTIGDSAFSRCEDLTNITIPDSVTTIGDSAFSECSNLTNITIPNSVTTIGSSVFSRCENLTNITIPNSVTTIGSHAFSECSNLTDITIPNSITTIGTSAFSSCDALTDVYYIGTETQWNQISIGSHNECLTNATIHYGIESDLLDTPKISSVANTATGVKITWGKVAGAVNYRVFYKANGESTWHKAGDTTATNYTWTNAKSGTKYTFTVRCISSDGSTYTSAYDTTGKSITYIAVPKLSSVANTATGVKISWAKSAGAAKYRVFYKANGESSWHKAGDTTSTSYTWTGAKSGTKYTFTVRCISSDGSTYTSAYDTTGKSITYIAAPKLSSVSNTTTGVQIKWGKVAGAAKYRVFYKANGESTWHKAGDTTSTSFTWTKAKSGTKYTFTVRCISSDGSTYTSAYDTTGKSITYIAAPKLSSVSNTTTGVQIKWGKVAGAAKYRVFYKANGESTWHKAGDTTSTSFTWTKAKSGTKYTFTVRCINSGATAYTSAYDTTGKSITYIAAPKLSSVTNAATGVTIKWGKSTGAAKYRVFYKTGNSGWKKLVDTTSTSYTWKGAKSGTKYTFTVRCVDKDGKNFTSAYNTSGKSLTYIAAPKLSSVANSATGVTIKWAKSTGAAKYRVFYKANGESTWHKAGDTTSTSFTWTKAKSGTKYTFTVRCISKDGKSYTSAYNTTGKSITFLSAPKITLSKASSGVQVKWGKVTGAVNYKIYRKTANGSYKAIGTTTSTSFVDKTAKKGTKYVYTVRCVSKDGKTTTSAYNAGKSITR